MVRHQMLCVITPQFAPPLAASPTWAATEQGLEQAMRAAGCVHFASLALLPAPPDRTAQRPSLMLELAVDDGPSPQQTIATLVRHGAQELRSIYAGHPGLTEPGDAALERLLCDHLSLADGGYIGARDRTVVQVGTEAAQLRAARQMLASLSAWPRDIETLVSMVRSNLGNGQIRGLAPRSFWRTRGGTWARRAAGVLLFVPVALVLLPLWALRGRLDRADASAEIPRAHHVDPLIEASERRLTGQPSHLISVTDVRRPYAWNAMWLRFFLRAITLLGHVVFTEGRLGGAASGIKFSHWHVIHGHRQLLFCANYDGAFGGYLDEFIVGATPGTNLFWRWTELRKRTATAGLPGIRADRSFPPTVLAVFGGCRNEQWFKAYARDSTLPHIWRFAAYAHTNDDVKRATRLRDALDGPDSGANRDQVMRAIES